MALRTFLKPLNEQRMQRKKMPLYPKRFKVEKELPVERPSVQLHIIPTIRPGDAFAPGEYPPSVTSWMDLYPIKGETEIRREVDALIATVYDDVTLDPEDWHDSWEVIDSRGLGGELNRSGLRRARMEDRGVETYLQHLLWVSSDYSLFQDHPCRWILYVAWLEQGRRCWGQAARFLQAYQGFFEQPEEFVEYVLDDGWEILSMPAWMREHLDLGAIWSEMQRRGIGEMVELPMPEGEPCRFFFLHSGSIR